MLERHRESEEAMSMERDKPQATPDSGGPWAGSGGPLDRVRQALGGGTPAGASAQTNGDDARDQQRGLRLPVWLVILALLAVNYFVGALFTPG
jgi:hypothetical protein